jgi:hypothetical protein
MISILQKLKRFWRSDERGAVAFITIVAAIPLTLLMFYMVNSAKAVNDRTRTQDAADMAVLAHAGEGARAMNTISMNQVSLTQAWTVTATAGTLNDLLIAQGLLLIAESAAVVANGAKYCKGPPPWIAICVARLAATEAVIVSHGVRALNINSRYKPNASYKVGKKSIKALNAMNNAVVDRYAKAAGFTASLVAKSANVRDMYFDKHCTSGCGNANITVKKHRMGMSLPVDKNPYPKAQLNFCAALHFGTVGAAISLPFPGLSSIGASLKNGSYLKRKFPSLKGPMRSGKGGRASMTDYINRQTGIGSLLTDNYNLSRNKLTLWIASSTWSYAKAGWPTKQKKDNNYYTQWMALKTAAACAAPKAVGDIFTKMALSPIPSYDLFHPKGVTVVKLFPSLADFTDDYKILGFTYRMPNKRWVPKVFKGPKSQQQKGFYAYSQGLIFNPDEMGLYSQNWQAKLIPAKRMENQLGAVTQRMGQLAQEGSSNFKDLQTDLNRVKSKASWGQVVAK